jgi:hypothetical protein
LSREPRAGEACPRATRGRSRSIVRALATGIDASPVTAPPNIDAIGNWWGCVAGPGNAGCDTVRPRLRFVEDDEVDRTRALEHGSATHRDVLSGERESPFTNILEGRRLLARELLFHA